MADLGIFPVPNLLSEQELEELNVEYVSSKFSLGVDTSEDIITIQDSSTVNCMQRALKLLLTEKGSIPTNTGYGTNLISLSKNGYNPNTIDEDVVVMLLDAETQCKKQDVVAGLPLAAQLGSIELIDLVLLNTSQLKLTIGIKTAAGITGSFDLQV